MVVREKCDEKREASFDRKGNCPTQAKRRLEWATRPVGRPSSDRSCILQSRVMSIQLILIAVALLTAASSPLLAQDIPDSCGTRDWFELREKMAAGESSLLCKGTMDAGFENRTAARRELNAVIRRLPHTASSSAAHETLLTMYFRHGQYREALGQLDQELNDKPYAADLKALRPLLAVLARYPDLATARRARSTVSGKTVDNNLFVPITVNGVSATYVLDTGAEISVLCESEAKRLGLEVQENSTKLNDISGTPSSLQVAEASDLWIGRIHLKNVAFAVFPDGNHPFVDLPAGHKGVLGIPVLLASGSLRIERNGHLVFGAIEPSPKENSNPLAFDQKTPLVQIHLNGKPLTFCLDTGAETTYLYKAFADAFPSLMGIGKHQQRKLTGISGSIMQESVELPSVSFRVSKDKNVELAPAFVILKTTTDASNWAAGNLGLDLLDQALPVTIDFRSMQITFGDR
jgi:predicted aspartyl protease